MSATISLLAERPAAAIAPLLKIWEGAVRATHDFLTEKDIRQLAPLVEQGLLAVPQLAVIRDESGAVKGFLGVDDDKIEMLFIEAGRRGQGLGRKLVDYAVEQLGASLVDVNEQNILGVGFYRRLGFVQFARSPLDGQGNPFPLLHLKLPTQ